MNRAFKKYLFLFCILLLNGYNNSYAHSFGNVERSFSISGRDVLDGPNGNIYEELPNTIFSDSSRFEIQRLLLAEVTDIEEKDEESDEALLSSSKKIVYGGFITAVFYALMYGHSYCEIEKGSPYFKPHTFTAPYKRHIRFQVFRI